MTLATADSMGRFSSRVLDRHQKLRSLGVSLFTVGTSGPDYDLSELSDWIAWRDAQNS
jgi:hypothetical protein